MLFNMTLLLAAEEAEERSGIDLVLPAVDELIWGTVAFAIVAFVLIRVAFPALREALEKRSQTIQNDLEQAEAAKSEADKMLGDYRKQLADARSEANRIIEEARQAADQVRKDITAKAESEAEQIVARASEQIEAERNRTVQELHGAIADLSIQLAEKVVGRTLDDQSQREFVDAYIRDVAAMPPSNGGSAN